MLSSSLRIVKRLRDARHAFLRPVLMGCVLASLSGCTSTDSNASKKSGATDSDEVPAVEVVTIRATDWPKTIRTQGSLIADESSVVGAKVAGRVEVIPIEFGDHVQADAVLARMDTADLELKVAQAEASHAQTCAVIGLKPNADLDEVKKENSPIVRQEKASLAEARGSLARVRKLEDDGAATTAQIEEAQAAVDIAEARYQASFNSVEEKLAIIRIRRAELSLAKQLLQDSTVQAPFEGLIKQRHVAPGAFVTVGQPIATLVRINPIRFRGQIPERMALHLKVGQVVEIQLENEAQPRRSIVKRISPALDEETRSLAFEADLPNPDGAMRAGLFATGQVIIQDDAKVIAVPSPAINEFAGVERVWVVADGKAKEVIVRTGQKLNGLTEVVSGVAIGDDIVVKSKALKAGQVEVIKRATLPESIAANQSEDASPSE